MTQFRKSMIRATAIAGILLLASCATGQSYQGLTASEPGAEVTFAKSYQGLRVGVSALQMYMLSTSQNCENLKLAASFTWTNGAEKTLRLPAGAPTYIYSQTSYLYTSSVSMIAGSPAANVASEKCGNAVQFTPEAGHAYSVRQTTSFRVKTCPIDIIDKATGTSVSDLKPAPKMAQCASYTG